ncbi:PLP-dependent aminotransferase family protein [Inquilinus sp. NPDC058860]|uniref:MocR-like pyridoxine biosynthesis transcription factor PdxR n=1 Tax=Inquilinus sp. NPDC058860 TaxID=3346652 RepID=UPI0036906D92
MVIRLDRDAPLQTQIYDQLKASILSGDAVPGARLPSSRALADQFAISRNTVLLAYEQLLAEGYLESRPGAGTFVGTALPAGAGPRPAAAVPPAEAPRAPRLSRYSERLRGLDIDSLTRRGGFRYSFHYGTVSAADFPADIWRRLLLREIRRRAGKPYLYENPQGLPELRAALSDYLARARAVRALPEQILIVNGSQQAVDLALRVLVDPGDTVVVEDPGYSGARLAVEAIGARLLPVPVDADGLDTARLPPPGAGARLIHVTPGHQFPTGGVMPAARRLALLDWAERGGTYVFEDDYDSEYRYEGRPVESLQALDRAGLVIYSGTVSKVLSPGLRLGYMVLPPELVEPFLRAKQLTDRHTASLDQAVFAHLIRDGHFERHIRRTRRRNQRRRDALVAALTSAFGAAVAIEGAKAGLHLVVRFRDIPAALAGSVAEAAALRSVGIVPAETGAAGTAGAGFLMGYAALEEADIRQGVALLREVVQSFRRGGAA